MGVDTDITIAKVVNCIRCDLVAGNLAAVLVSDSLCGIFTEGRISDIDGTCNNAVELICIGNLTEVDVLGLRCALVEVFVSFEVNNTVFKLDELVHAGTHRLGCLGADQAQIALRETEHVVIIIILSCIAIIVHRCNVHGQLVDHVGIHLCSLYSHGVIAGLNDTGDVRGCLTDGDTSGRIVINIFRDQVGQSGTCGLSFHLGEGPAIVVTDSQEEVFCCSAVFKLEAPVACSGLDIFCVCSQTICYAVVNDLLCELNAAVIDCIPESLLLLFCEVGEICVVFTSCNDQVSQGVDT